MLFFVDVLYWLIPFMVLFVAVVGDDFWVRLFGLFLVFLVDIFRGYFGVMYIFQRYLGKTV